jgi:hypothetical protein
MIVVTYDLAARAIEIDTSAALPWGGAVVGRLASVPGRIDTRGASLSITVTAAGVTALDLTWPPEGTEWLQTGQEGLLARAAVWNPGDAVEVAVTIQTADGPVSAAAAFVAPDPPPGEPD